MQDQTVDAVKSLQQRVEQNEQRIIKNERVQRKANLIINGYIPNKISKTAVNGLQETDYSVIKRDICKMYEFDSKFGTGTKSLLFVNPCFKRLSNIYNHF